MHKLITIKGQIRINGGSEIGVPLNTAGGIISGAGSIMEGVIDFTDGNKKSGYTNFGYLIGGKVLDLGLQKVIPAGKTQVLIRQGASVGLSGVQRATKSE